MKNRFFFFILIVCISLGCSSNKLYNFEVTTWKHGEAQSFRLKNKDMIFEFSPSMRANGIMSDDFLIARPSFSFLYTEEGKYDGIPSVSYSNNEEGEDAVTWFDFNADGNFDGYIANKKYYVFYKGKFYQHMYRKGFSYVLINDTEKVCINFNPKIGRFEKVNKCL